ncbi:Coumaroyl-CoA:anthocyanidin 3-O-glucoside-6''-O-coumaroyltransferase 1 [Linum grandiflorum]
MSQHSSAVKTVAELQISPPPGSVPPNPLPLTFFDIKFLHFGPVYRILFFDFPNPTSDFHSTVVPKLTASLSVALGHFYPFAGRITVPPLPGKPHINYPEDRCSVPFTVAESTTLDYHVTDQINDVALLEPLFPARGKPSDGDGTAAVVLSPLLAVKATLFPGSGFSIASAYNHATCDGKAFNNFMKAWSSICKSGDDQNWVLQNSPPCYDRAIVKDEKNVEEAYLEQSWKIINSPALKSAPNQFSNGKFRGTFLIDGDTVSKLKASLPFPASDFVVASALIWTTFTKSFDGTDQDQQPIIDSFMFVADCRRLLSPPLPETYFGNCLSTVRASLKRSELVAGGFATAAGEIAAKINEKKVEVLRDEEKWFYETAEMAKQGKVAIVGGSPRLRVYETDFGFGRPRKSDLVLLSGFAVLINLSDARDEKRGGIEFGVLLNKSEMDIFAAEFERRLTMIHSDHQNQ